VLGGTDALVFTGGIAENTPIVRRKVCEGLECFGITLDEQKNQKPATLINTGPTPVLIIARNEELAIARETYQLLYEKYQKRHEEQDILEIQASLRTLTDADKAKITLLWSQHRDVSHKQLFEIVQHEMHVNIDINAFEVLLKNMGFAKH
jgi:hypothetical protein